MTIMPGLDAYGVECDCVSGKAILDLLGRILDCYSPRLTPLFQLVVDMPVNRKNTLILSKLKIWCQIKSSG